MYIIIPHGRIAQSQRNFKILIKPSGQMRHLDTNILPLTLILYGTLVICHAMYCVSACWMSGAPA